MALALLLALSASQDPAIEKVERLLGPLQRPLRWAPLSVELHAASGAWSGDVVVRSGFGFAVARRVSLPAGARERLVLPALDPVSVEAGASAFRVPRASARAGRAVGIDARLPYAADPPPAEDVHYVTIRADDLGPLLAAGFLEALDLVLLSASPGAPPEGAQVAPAREDAARAVEALARPAERIEAVDAAAWALAPEGGWVPAKRTTAVFFAAVYALAVFAALVTVARRGARWAAGTLGGLVLLGAGAYLLLFPRGQLWIRESACELAPLAGEARVWRVWFAGAAAERSAAIEFPRVVKPVFPQSSGADEPFTIRVGEGAGCRVEGLRLAPGHAACFAASESRPPTMRASEGIAVPLYRASILVGNRNRELGDLGPGDALPSEVPEDGPAPLGPEVQAFRRFIVTDAVFGRLDREEGPAEGLSSPELADPRAGPRFYVGRIR